MSAIFISYRRSDAGPHARALFERLKSEFGARDVFIDQDGIEYGDDFVDMLQRRLSGCQVMVALIGPRWANARDDAGNRRIDQLYDYVRTEIATALARGIRTIPVLIDGAEMPKAEDLPEPLRPLTRRNALMLDFNRFEADVARLIPALRGIVGNSTTPPPPDPGVGHSRSTESSPPSAKRHISETPHPAGRPQPPQHEAARNADLELPRPSPLESPSATRPAVAKEAESNTSPDGPVRRVPENQKRAPRMRKAAFVSIVILLSLAVWQTSRHPNNLLLDMAGDANGDAVSMLKLAVFLGANINARDKDGLTASQRALRHGNAENLSYLLDHGAEITGINPEGRFPLYDAIMPDSNSFLMDSSARARIVRVLLQHRANANERDTRKVPILAWAAFEGPLDVVADLIEHGAEVNAASPTGDTPLHFAAQYSNNPSILEFLVAHGANRDARNHEGKIPLEVLNTSKSVKDEATRSAMAAVLQH